MLLTIILPQTSEMTLVGGASVGGVYVVPSRLYWPVSKALFATGGWSYLTFWCTVYVLAGVTNAAQKQHLVVTSRGQCRKGGTLRRYQ